MPLIDRDGVPLYYETMGEGEPLLMIMGLGGDHRGWMMQIPAFNAYKLILPDNRCTGRSGSGEGDLSIEAMAKDALAVLDAEDISRCHVLGISMGGMISQTIVHLAPERVATLTLTATYAAPGAYESNLVKTTLKNLTGHDEVIPETYTTTQVTVDDILNFTMPLLLTATFIREKRELIKGFMEMMAGGRPDIKGYIRQLVAAQSFDGRNWLPEIKCPTHVIKPEKDQLVSPERSDELASGIPGAKLSVLPGAPHGCTFENADAFNALALGFIRAHPLAG